MGRGIVTGTGLISGLCGRSGGVDAFSKIEHKVRYVTCNGVA